MSAYWSSSVQRQPLAQSQHVPQQPQFVGAGSSQQHQQLGQHQHRQQQQYGGARTHQAGGPPPAPTTADGRLHSVDELPACFRGVFRFRFFNAIQNECWPIVFDSSSNVVIAAPTGGGAPPITALLTLGAVFLCPRLPAPTNCFATHTRCALRPAGKTALLELACLRLLSRHITAAGQFAHKPGHLKAVYIAPTRSLVQASQPGQVFPAW